MTPDSRDHGRLDDELFCQQFELRTLAGVVAEGRLERWVPGFSPAAVERDHFTRYRWACRYVRGLTVLDVACGAGGGSRILADEGGAALVVGCDLDRDAARYATLRHGHPAVRRSVADAAALPLRARFDVVVSFETVEHLRDAEAFLRAARAVLVPGGTFLVSSPIAAVAEDRAPANPHHVTEWGFEAFRALIGQHFRVDEVWLQTVEVPSPSLGARLRRLAARVAGSPPPPAPVPRLEPWDPVRLPAHRVGLAVTGFQVLLTRAPER